MEKYKLPQQELDIYESLRQPFAIYQFVDKRVVTLALSAGFCNLFGYENHADAYFDMNNDMYKDVHPDDVARIANAAFRFATEGGKYEVIYRVMPKGNTGSRVIHAFGEHVYTATGERLAHVWYSDEGSYLHRDGQPGTELNQSLSNALHENSILKATQYDYLTGLPSMTYFFELAEVGKGIIKGKGGRPVMMYMDFSGMKFYNAKYGFGEGNKLLQSFAKILASTFGNEQCCRIGSDHFAAYDEEEGLDEKLQKMLLACRNINEGRSLPIHVGVYVSQNERVHTSFACDRAKLACAEIGGRVESAVNYYSKELSEKAIQKRYFVEHLDQAISENWIQIYLQPIVRAVNGQVCEVEALARWIDPERGFASPADFIPLLEDAGVIYKLDLYIVDKILEYIKREETIGIMIVPHSVNLSRSDFDACDIVEEIRRRVDDAGIGRDKLTIEITESMIGKGFTFMKEQVSRFQSLGFHVWMDDFGSGYSSLNVLQSIKFDLIKFDMLFMRRFYDGDTGKIILNELMGLANALGLDTVCEGVETEEQVRFLQEIGCSKLQGYYFSRPIPFETLRDLYDKNIQIKRENPAESEYYAYVGRANLLDLAISTDDEEEGSLKEKNMYKVLDVLPIAILEVRGQRGRYIRSNLSYRDFVKRYFELDVIKEEINFSGSKTGVGAAFLKAIMQCCDTGSRTFFDEKMSDGTAVHALVRRLAENPVTGNVSVAIIVLSITEPDEETTTYAEIAKAFAADYYNIYLIDLNTNNYMEYASQAGSEEMTLERHGEDFFELSRRDAMRRIYEEDREAFVALFTKENVLRDIEKHGVFTMTYRLMDTGSPVYVNMKATRMQGGNRLIIGISNIDARRKQEEEEKRLRQERAALGRIAALSPEFIVLYTVDPKTGHYTQFNPSSAFKRFGLAKQGEDFFRDVVLDSPRAIAPEDLENHLRMLTMENMLSEIKEHGFFTHHYHMLIDGERIPACLKATLFEEEDGEKIILGVTNDETEEFRRKLEEAKKIREMNQTISSLLDNMPGLTFTKDAETGVYLTCNQAFANYAHKVTPEGVAGLTDTQIFDAETATHFVADDRIAIAKNEPHVFFEDVPDAAGNHRQLQTTKFTFKASNGRLCLQGMSQDLTDLLSARRENMTNKIAYIDANNKAVIYNHIAHALAREYLDLFYVNMETGEVIRFNTDRESGVLSEGGREADFLESCKRKAKYYVHPEDLEQFIRAMSWENIKRTLDEKGIFEQIYRRVMNGRVFYVQMRATRMEDDDRILVFSVSDIDELMRKRRAEKRVQEERLIYARLHAITGNFIVVYVVDPATNQYREFSATEEYSESFRTEKGGEDFFASVRQVALLYTYPKDLAPFLKAFDKENILSEIEQNGIFTWDYRILMHNKPLYVQMKAAMVEEKEGPRLIVGLNDIDAQVRREEDNGRRLAEAKLQASIDGLTGVKNKHAYLDVEDQMNLMIECRTQAPFAVVIFDVNDLKIVNDTAGHQAGDQYLRDSCQIICNIFKHSPVFRVGGDEFAVIAQKFDYTHIEDRIADMERHNTEALRSNGIVIAYGMSRFRDGDDCVAAVFRRADQRMYENKIALKGEARDK